jgi:hypothetical protein
VANAPFSHVIDVGAPEGSEALLADLTQRLRAALDASGASTVRFEVRRSAELPRGRVRVVRLLVGGAALTAPMSAASAEAIRAAVASGAGH